MSHVFKAAVALFAACFLLTAPTHRALGQDVPRLRGQITDLTTAHVLARQQTEMESALRELQRDRDIQLWALFVETTGGRTVTEFANEVARQNSLGSNDALLVVALSDRTDAMWRGGSMQERLTDRELEQVLSRRVEPFLAQGDFSGAVVGATRGLADVAGQGETRGDESGGPVRDLLPLVVIAVLAVGGLWLWITLSQRREHRLAQDERDRQTGLLAREANALLIEADEDLRAAQQEIGFAELEFTEEDVAPFKEAIKQASAELTAAFTVRQQLDDDTPEDADARRGMLEEIIQRARHAKTLLEDDQKRIQELRDLERNAPQILAGLPAQLDAAEQRIPEAQRTVESLMRYSERARVSVRGNIAEAEKRLSHARTEVERGQQALAGNQSSLAARSARAAQQALSEALRLLDAIDTLSKSIRQAEAAVGPQIATAQADIQAAQTAAATRPGHFHDRIAVAERALKGAESKVAAQEPDFLSAHRLATEAEAIADEVLAGLRGEGERRAREAETLTTQLRLAQSAYDRAENYIAGRHRNAGREARTRLTEAGRYLGEAQALSDTDPTAALEAARRAQQLADAAYAMAQDDFNQHDGRRGRGIPFPVPIILGGGRGDSGGGWGGTPWGSGGGSIGGGWGGGGSVGGRW